jgi:hypothetical protein
MGALYVWAAVAFKDGDEPGGRDTWTQAAGVGCAANDWDAAARARTAALTLAPEADGWRDHAWFVRRSGPLPAIFLPNGRPWATSIVPYTMRSAP